MTKFKVSETFPEAFNRFEKYVKTNDLVIRSNNDLLLHFMTWGSMKGVNYAPMTDKQVKNIRYEAKERNMGYAVRIFNTNPRSKKDFQYRDTFSGRFISENKFNEQIRGKS